MSRPELRAVCYPRVSSDVQRERHTIDSQIQTLPAYVKEQGWALVKPADYYADDGRSAKAGQLDKREGFKRLLADAGRGLFDVVAVVDLDRLTRSEDLQERGYILGAFQRAGVKIAIASKGQIHDVDSMQGQMMASMDAIFAMEENRKRRERTMRGRLEAIRKGRKPPGATPYGFNYNRLTGEWSEHEEQARVVRRIFQDTVDGFSLYRLQCDLQDEGAPRPRAGRWTREGLRKLIRNAGYRGEWLADVRRKLTVKVPAIVSDDLWHAAQEALSGRRNYVMPRAKRVALLEGIVYCEVCGGKVWAVSSPRRYTCATKHHVSREVRGERCPNPSMRVDVADEKVWRTVRSVIDNPETLVRATEAGRRAPDAADAKRDLAKVDKLLRQLEDHETATLALSRRGKISQRGMESELDRITRERKILERNRADASKRIAAATRQQESAQAALDVLAALRERVDTATPEERRDLVRLVVERATIGKSGIRLHGRVAVGAATVPTTSTLAAAR